MFCYTDLFLTILRNGKEVRKYIWNIGPSTIEAILKQGVVPFYVDIGRLSFSEGSDLNVSTAI
jgi:hypothetical protein